MSDSTGMIDIAVFTSTRADYGLLSMTIARMGKSQQLRPVVIASGTHLTERFGYTVETIKAEQDCEIVEINMGLDEDDLVSLTSACARLTQELGKCLAQRQFGAMMVLGDVWPEVPDFCHKFAGKNELGNDAG